MKTEKELEGIINKMRFPKSHCTIPFFERKGGRNGNWKNSNICNGGINLLFGLYDLIIENFKKDYVIVEVGCFAGISTELFANMCKKVYAIDPWNSIGYSEVPKDLLIEGENNFDIINEKYENIIKIKDFSVAASLQFEDESIDAVYIDGEHKYDAVKEDIITWLPKVKKNGCISGHDFMDKGVQKALKELFPNNKLEMYCDTSWCIKKNEIIK